MKFNSDILYTWHNSLSVLMAWSVVPTSINSKPNYENLHGYISDVFHSMKNCIIVRNDKIPHKIFLIKRNCGYWDRLNRYCTVKLKEMISYIFAFLYSLKHEGIRFCSVVIYEIFFWKKLISTFREFFHTFNSVWHECFFSKWMNQWWIVLWFIYTKLLVMKWKLTTGIIWKF